MTTKIQITAVLALFRDKHAINQISTAYMHKQYAFRKELMSITALSKELLEWKKDIE